MQLSLQNSQTLLVNAASAVQGACSKLINLKPGSVIRALLQAFSATGLWFQYLIVQVWLGSRLATSSDVDVDSFIGDFGLTRLQPIAATGTVTFNRFNSDNSILIQPYFAADGTVLNTNGAQVLSADSTQAFGVKVDLHQPRWNPSQNAYYMPVGINTIDVTVQAIVTGSGGNVSAGGISQMATAIPGVDTVTNAQPFSNGSDEESDASVKTRFVNFINTRARATLAAVEFAISSVQAGLTYSIAENQDELGAPDPGHFVVTLDDGSGSPGAALISAVYSAIDQVRPVGSTFSVTGPKSQTVTVSMTITVGPNGNKSLLIPAVQTNIIDYIDTLPIGAALPWSKLAQVAYETDPNITNVTAILLNGLTLDVTPNINGVIKAGVVAIN